MSAQDSGSRRFESNIGLSFSQADLVPTSGPKLFFAGFSKNLALTVLRNVSLATCTWKNVTGIFGIQTLYGNFSIGTQVLLGLPNDKPCFFLVDIQQNQCAFRFFDHASYAVTKFQNRDTS